MSITYFAILIGCAFIWHVEGKTCYEGSCFGENCLQAISSTCEMNEQYGCEFSQTSSGSGAIVNAGCSTSPCTPAPEPFYIQCCMESNCNTGISGTDPGSSLTSPPSVSTSPPSGGDTGGSSHGRQLPVITLIIAGCLAIMIAC